MSEKLAEIFKDTFTKYSSNHVLKNACENTRKNEKLYLADEKIDCDKNLFEEKAHIIVSKKRTFEAAVAYKGARTAVLNFAI